MRLPVPDIVMTTTMIDHDKDDHDISRSRWTRQVERDNQAQATGTEHRRNAGFIQGLAGSLERSSLHPFIRLSIRYSSSATYIPTLIVEEAE